MKKHLHLELHREYHETTELIKDFSVITTLFKVSPSKVYKICLELHSAPPPAGPQEREKAHLMWGKCQNNKHLISGHTKRGFSKHGDSSVDVYKRCCQWEAI